MPAHASKIKSEQRKRRGRKPFLSAEIELLTPPSANSLWFNAPGRGRYKTKEYRPWIGEVGWILKEQAVPMIPRNVSLKIAAGLTKRTRDLDNLLKAICDLLQASNIIDNDARIYDLSAKWDKIIPNGKVRVRVRQSVPPEWRMSKEGRQRLSIQKRGRMRTSGSLALGLMQSGVGA